MNDRDRFAKDFSQMLGREPQSKQGQPIDHPQEPEEQQSSALDPLSQPTADVGEALGIVSKREAGARFVRAMHGLPTGGQSADDESEPDELPDFDGGVRESVPPPSDPVQEHNRLLVDLAKLASLGGARW